MLHRGAVGRAHNAVPGDDLFHPMGAPARDTGRREQRRIEILRQVEHVVNESGIEVNVGAHRQLLMLARHDLLNSKLFYALHQLQIVQPSLFPG